MVAVDKTALPKMWQAHMLMEKKKKKKKKKTPKYKISYKSIFFPFTADDGA